MEKSIQDQVNEFKMGEWFGKFKADKKGFLKQLPSFDFYNNIDWNMQSDTTVMECCVKWAGIGAINVLESFAIFKCSEREKFKNLLEIGRFKGRSTLLQSIIAKKNGGVLFSIDPRSSVGLSKSFKELGLLDYIVFEDNWSPWVKLPLPMDQIDFLFVDGDHSFISVLVDYHFFYYFVKKGGIIGFHDMGKPEVREAVDKIIERDHLEEICRIKQLCLYRKVHEDKERYFQLLTFYKNYDREKLHNLRM